MAFFIWTASPVLLSALLLAALAHELGHAWHNECIKAHRPLNHDYSMPLAETASTFNECVVMASAIAKAADISKG